MGTESLREAIAGGGGAYEAPLAVLREAQASSTSRWTIGLQRTRWCSIYFSQRALNEWRGGQVFERHIKKSMWRSVSAPRIHTRARRSCQDIAARICSKHHSRGAP